MSEYRKGRVLVLLGMLGFSTISVLVGTAGADAGTLKVKSTSPSGYVYNGTSNEPILSNSCVGVSIDWQTTSAPVFELVNPTSGGVVSGTATTVGSDSAFDLAAALQATTVAPGPQGYHLRVSVDGKQKVFWVKAGSPGCGALTGGFSGSTF